MFTRKELAYFNECRHVYPWIGNCAVSSGLILITDNMFNKEWRFFKYSLEGTDYYVVVEDETIECDGQTHRYICYGQGEYISGIAFNYSVQPKQLTADMFSLSPQTYVYDGQHHTPDVSGTYNNMTMVEGTDYSVVEDEDTISAGMHHLTINGSGNYTGSCQVEYPIQARDIAEAEIIIGQETLVYNGKEQIPDVVVKDGGKTLEKDKDYTLTTDEATSAGKHTIIIKGVNNYQGSVSPTYTIAKAEKPFVMPSSEYSVPYSTKALTDDILSDAPETLLDPGTFF